MGEGRRQRAARQLGDDGMIAQLEAGRQALSDNESLERLQRRQRARRRHADQQEEQQEPIRRRRYSDGDGSSEEEGEQRRKVVPPMSIAEKKRLQWEKEKAELAGILAYNPWGRPGAGAPPTSLPVTETSAGPVQPSPRQPPAGHTQTNRKPAETTATARYSQQQQQGQTEEEARYLVSSVASNAEELMAGTGPMYGRGRGLASLEEIAPGQVEERRRKQAEHQEAIRRQVEERERQRAAERERRAQEEQEEEAKLTLERDRIQRQFEEEAAKHRRKEEVEIRRVAVLKERMDAAEEAARLDKQMRRLAHLEEGGHDTHRLRAGLEASIGRNPGGLPSVTQQQVPLEGPVDEATRASQTEPFVVASNFGNSETWPSPRQSEQPLGSQQPRHQYPRAADFGRQGGERRGEHGVQTDTSLLLGMLLDNMSSQQQQQQTFQSGFRDQLGLAVAAEKGSRMRTQQLQQQQQEQQTGPVTTGQLTRNRRVEQKEKVKHIRKPVPIESRPLWGARGRNTKQGARVKTQSERDPFWEEQRAEREARHVVHQSQLRALVQLNADRIPSQLESRRTAGTGSQQRHHNCVHPEEEMETARSGTSRLHMHPQRKSVTPPPSTVRHVASYRRLGGAGESRILEEDEAGTNIRSAPVSPQLAAGQALYSSRHAGGDTPTAQLNLVRTTDILNPAFADWPMPISREGTGREKARQAHLRNLHPAEYGQFMDNAPDTRTWSGDHDTTGNRFLPPTRPTRDTLLNPKHFREGATHRQEVILKQLSDIRRGLLYKQKEIETSLSMTEKGTMY